MVGVEDAVAWVALRRAAGVGDVVGRKLVDACGGAAAVREASSQRCVSLGAPGTLPATLADPTVVAEARRELERVVAAGARLVPVHDPEYPPPLREMHAAPLFLIAKGASLVVTPAVAIVGARRATAYGLDVARRLAADLAAAGVTVVSGLARGIDGAAHEGALAARGHTIAVLGSGIDVAHPPEHTDLAARIVADGTLLSEHPVGTAPLPAHFPARNRILAGMTQGTIVIEAAERSGSLITARLANEHGREVFAVPGRIDSPLSHGAHLLISQGATLVRGVEDVLAQIAPALRARAGDATSGGRRSNELPDLGMALVEILGAGEATVDDLIRTSGRPAGDILATLLDLELRGVLRRVGGRQLQLTGRFAGVGGLQ